MCNVACLYFALENLSEQEVRGRSVLEVGSRDVNGSVRGIVERWQPAAYVGVDVQVGRGVDLLCPAEKLIERFGVESFDIIISTEMVEHVFDWRTVFSNIKQVCKRNGIILLTTRSRGFPCHDYNDFWRYEGEDMKRILGDCQILVLERDYISPGVFVKARKPIDFHELDLSTYQLYGIPKRSQLRPLVHYLVDALGI
jgi:SAM-dependent methyltransferase